MKKSAPKKKMRLTINDKAFLAMKEAVRKVRAEHRKLGLPLYVWRDGRVQKIKA